MRLMICLSYDVRSHISWGGKMLRPHASEDSPSPFMMVWTCTLRGRKTIIIFIIMLRWSLFLNRYSASTTTRECSPDKKGA